MSIYITNRDSVPAYANVPISHIFSIGDQVDCPNIQPFRNRDFIFYRYSFQDVSDTQHEQPPTKEIVQRMIDIFKDIIYNENGPSNILFHCSAGVSRSPATAYIYLIVRGWSYEAAYKKILSARYPNNDISYLYNNRHMLISPNKLMIYYADQILEKNGEMLKYILEVSNDNSWTFK